MARRRDPRRRLDAYAIGSTMESLLTFFISDAAAQAAGAPAAGAGGLGTLLLPVLLIVVFYFLLIRPQQKKQKEHRAMLDALTAGTEVVTGGGVLGRVTDVGEQFVTVEVASGIQVKVQKHSIAAVLPKDTIKNV
jgi:preprotein translocase subunit YajC